jgi:hypothetical protein
MSTSTTIPVTVTPEAAARIADLGLETGVERMIDHARRHLPEVERIEVVLYDRYDLGDEPGLAVDIYSRHPFNENESISGDLSKWFVRAFPSEVLEHVIMDYHPGGFSCEVENSWSWPGNFSPRVRHPGTGAPSSSTPTMPCSWSVARP